MDRFKKQNEYDYYIFAARRVTDSLIRNTGIACSEKSLAEFKAIIDSINQQFSQTKSPGVFYSKQQALAHFVELKGKNIDAAIKDMQQNISFGAFCKKYSKAEITKNQIVTREKNSETRIGFKSLPLDNEDETGWSMELGDPNFFTDRLEGGWVYEYGNDYLFAWYFPYGFSVSELPTKYEYFISYFKYITEKRISMYLPNSPYGRRYSDIDSSEQVTAFIDYVNKQTNKPDISSISSMLPWTFYYTDLKDAYKNYLESEERDNSFRKEKVAPDNESVFSSKVNIAKSYKDWFYNRYSIIDQELVNTPKFRRLFNNAVEDALKRGYTNEIMEDYVEHFGNKKDALRLKRGRRIWTSCGNDDAPRYHIYNILRLSVETLSRRLFMETYLFLLQNKFDGRQFNNHPLIDESEKFGYDEEALLFSTMLEYDKPDRRYWYYNRSEENAQIINSSKHRDLFLKELAAMIEDKGLDDYNRLMASKTFIRCISSKVVSIEQRNEDVELLKYAIKNLPEYYRPQLTLPEKWPEKKKK